MANVQENKSVGMGRDIMVYVALLALAGIQFVIAYSTVDSSQMLTRMMAVAVIEAGLALLFFMHLSENKGLKWFVLIFSIAVILGMQYSWTDSYRIINGVPWAK